MGDNTNKNQNLSIRDKSLNNNSMNAIFERLSIGKDGTPLFTAVDNNKLSTGKFANDEKSEGSISNDHALSQEVGFSFVISDKLLGHGSYGDVFLATDENNKQLAVKCCDIDDTGIPNILEASIMGSIVHPYLNRALRIQASDTKLYIIQELAVTDLAQHTRRDKGNHKPSMDELKRWCYCLSQGVNALHNDDIIHADIKASNILLYQDGSIRLTDYTLATKKWSFGEKFNHNVCTCTHRPLECLMRRPWDESIDIWSLGCTFYEIAYGELLFPYQGALEDDPKIKDKDTKIRLRNRSINAIIDWSSRGPNPPTSFEVIGIQQYAIDYIPFVLCDDFKKPEMAIFNDMLCKMLVVDPDKRLTINQVLNHPFFTEMKGPIYLSIRRSPNKIPVSEQARVTRYIQRYSANEAAQSLALNIYCSCNDLISLTEHIRAAACTWIASKIVVGYPPTISLPPNQLLSAERDICHNLLFRLHNI
jgi:serine/threonine protein kinase